MTRRCAEPPQDSAQPESDQQLKLKGFDDFDLRLGDIMRAERATLGISLLDVQDALKIRSSYIVAIENCDPSAFDVLAFLPGHVRSYARYLGLDPDWVLAKFCKEANYSIENQPGPAVSGAVSGDTEQIKPVIEKRDLSKLANVPFIPKPDGFLSRIDPPALISSAALGGLILALGYGGLMILQELQRVQIVQNEQAADSVAPVAPFAVADAMGSSETDDIEIAEPGPEAFERLYRRPQVLESPVVTPRDPAIITLDPTRVATVTEVKGEVTALQDISLPEGVEVEQPDQPVQVVEEPAEDLVKEVFLLAVRPSWIRISTADNSVLLEKILDGGERFAVPKTEQPPILRTGNAGSVYALVGGETYGPLGNGPEVVDGIVMGPEEVVASFVVADLTSDSRLAEYVVVAQDETASDSSQ